MLSGKNQPELDFRGGIPTLLAGFRMSSSLPAHKAQSPSFFLGPDPPVSCAEELGVANELVDRTPSRYQKQSAQTQANKSEWNGKDLLWLSPGTSHLQDKTSVTFRKSVSTTLGFFVRRLRQHGELFPLETPICLGCGIRSQTGSTWHRSSQTSGRSKKKKKQAGSKNHSSTGAPETFRDLPYLPAYHKANRLK